jgi:hypothetical protein
VLELHVFVDGGGRFVAARDPLPFVIGIPLLQRNSQTGEENSLLHARRSRFVPASSIDLTGSYFSFKLNLQSHFFFLFKPANKTFQQNMNPTS